MKRFILFLALAYSLRADEVTSETCIGPGTCTFAYGASNDPLFGGAGYADITATPRAGTVATTTATLSVTFSETVIFASSGQFAGQFSIAPDPSSFYYDDRMQDGAGYGYVSFLLVPTGPIQAGVPVTLSATVDAQISSVGATTGFLEFGEYFAYNFYNADGQLIYGETPSYVVVTPELPSLILGGVALLVMCELARRRVELPSR